MEKFIQLTDIELNMLITEIVKRTVSEMQLVQISNELISKNEARKMLKIGYKKLDDLINEGKIKLIAGKIQKNQILSII